jgi:hypothetical protein
MTKAGITDRVLLLLAVLLASYQVVVGIEGLPSNAIISYTLGFGALLIAGLLIFILGLEAMDNQYVAVVSTIVPLSLSAGLVAEYFPRFTVTYSIFACIAFVFVLLTRFFTSARIATITLVSIHSIAGLLIFLLPLWLAASGIASPGFILVGIAGGLIGAYGLVLSFLRMDHPLISPQVTMRVFPPLLAVVTAAFVFGFVF